MNTGSIETTLVSRLTQDVEDLRQDKQYLREDLTRLQRELQRERLEKERYRRRVGELEDLLERVQKGNSAAVRANASQGSVKLEQFATRSAGTLRKSPSLEIIGFKEPPSPPHSLIDVDVNEAESKPTVNEGEVDYENQDPNFAYLADENGQLSAVNVINEDSLDAADTSDSTPLQAKDHMETGSVEDVGDDCGPDAPPPPSDKALGKRKVSDDPPTFSSGPKRSKVSRQPSKSVTGPLLPVQPPCTPAPQSDALERLSPSSPPDPSSGSLYHQQDGPPSSLDAEACSSSITTPIPPLPFRPRVTAGFGPSSLSISAAPTPSNSVSSATAPVPPLPFRPRLVRNFKIKEEEAVILPVDIVANYLQDVPTFSINPDPSGIPFVSRKFLAKVYGGSDRQFLQYVEVPQPLSNPSSRSSTSASSSSSSSTSTSATSISPTRRRRKPLMFPTPEMNPSMPLFPGDAGLIFTSRTEILKNGPWSVFRKYDRGIDVEVKREGDPCSSEMGGKGDGKSNKKGKGKQKSVVWVYVGDYECTRVGKISRAEWGAQNHEVKKRWANRVTSKMTGCYLSMRARIGLRKAGIAPGSSPTPASTPSTVPPTNGPPPTDAVGPNESTNDVPGSSSAPTPSSSASSVPLTDNSDEDQLDEDSGSRYERLLLEEISAHRSRKPKHPITEHDILEAFERGEEGVDIVQLKCVAYDWEWARDFEGRWERGERAKWWEADGAGEGEGDESEGESRKPKKKSSQRGGQTQDTSIGAQRRSARTRGKGQVQVEPDVGAAGNLSLNEPVDDCGEVTTTPAVLPFSQISPRSVASLKPLTSSLSISMMTTPASSALRPQLNPESGDTRDPISTDSDDGGGGVGGIDDGYLSYASEEEMDIGSGNLDDSMGDIEGCGEGDGA